MTPVRFDRCDTIVAPEKRFKYFSNRILTFRHLLEKRSVLSTCGTFSLYRRDRHHLKFNSTRRQTSRTNHMPGESRFTNTTETTIHYPKAQKGKYAFPFVQSEYSVSAFICLSRQIWSRNEREEKVKGGWRKGNLTAAAPVYGKR